MKIWNTYNHKELGEMYCIGDEERPYRWMKKVSAKVFSDKEEELEAHLNFWCFDMNFELHSSRIKKYTENVEKDVISCYHKMLESIHELEEEFIRFYNCFEFWKEFIPYYKEEEYQEELPAVKVIEDIYPCIEEKVLCVYQDGFGVALKLKFAEMPIVVEKTNIFDEDGGYAYTQTIETSQIISMHYIEK